MPHPHSRFRAVAAAAILGVPLLAGAAASKPAIRAEGTYAILNGADTAVLERWVRSDDSLKVTMDVIGQVRLEFTASTNSDATFSNMSMQVFQPGSNEAVEEAHAEFRDDSVIARQKVQAGMDTVRRATRAGAVPYLSPSVTLTEQIVRRARAIGGDSVAVPVFVVGSGGQTLDATVLFAGDSAVVKMGPSEMRLGLAADGSLTGGVVPQQATVRIVRVGG
ncbi:MAG TPA: hypothetical protein VKZ41_11490 [Gemmatimonadales bacterium]|nr:hypothetical protein [Gemmatimonadales bacterium]